MKRKSLARSTTALLLLAALSPAAAQLPRAQAEKELARKVPAGSVQAPEGKPAESMRPALESLMKTILARLP